MQSAPRIAVLDTGAGNLHSVLRALERAGAKPCVAQRAEALRSADAALLPGVGAFAAAAAHLAETGLGAALCESIAQGRPYLGICLGLELLFQEGDEHGGAAGLGLLPGRVRRFPQRTPEGAPLRVPHIGWNRVTWRSAHPLVKSLPPHDHYYFVHAHRAEPGCAAHWAGSCDYGGPFAAAVAWDNAFAVQFHPEKSQGAGHRLLQGFLAWLRAC